MLFSFLCIVAVLSASAPSAFAETEDVALQELYSVKQVVSKVLEETAINSYEYLYNLDDSADYILVNLEPSGYAIFHRETMEMMEYSKQGESPYQALSSKGYYGGPAQYLQKNGNDFCNLKTGETISISTEEVSRIAEENRALFSDEIATKRIAPVVSAINQPSASMQSVSATDTPIVTTDRSGTYIENAQYFLAKPTHGTNDGATVVGNANADLSGPIAAQLLLGYFNYYNYSRFLPDKFLNDQGNNPKYCADPMKWDSLTLGTRSESSGENSFFYHMVTKIMGSSTSTPTITKVRDGMAAY